MLRDRVDEVSLRLENSSEKVSVPVLELAKPSETEVRILKEIYKSREPTQRKMARNLDRKISSISRTLARLETKGLVTKKEGKPSVYSLTRLGSLMLK